MALHPLQFGSIQLPDFAESRPPRHHEDGVRLVRRPRLYRPEGRS